MNKKIIYGSYNNASIILSDITPTFSNGLATITISSFDELIGKTLVNAIAQLKSASAAVVTSCRVISNTSIEIRCANLSGSAYSGQIGITLLMIAA